MLPPVMYHKDARKPTRYKPLYRVFHMTSRQPHWCTETMHEIAATLISQKISSCVNTLFL